MVVNERREKLLLKLLAENYDLLEQYERQLNLESDPRAQLKIRENLNWVHQRNAELEQQLENLKKPAAEASLVASALVSFNAPPADPLEAHFANLVSLFKQGRVISVLGDGINLLGRPAGAAWDLNRYPPTVEELAEHLAENFDYPPGSTPDLARVTQYASVLHRPGPLYDRLRQLYEVNYPPNDLHHFFASLPLLLRKKVANPRFPIIVTTNYDDLLERAFEEVDEPFDLLSYVAEGEQRNKFLHLPPGESDWIPIDDPNKYLGLKLEQRPVIIKMHGALNRFNSRQDGLVITEDHFINYMARTEISKLIPASIMRELRNSSLLFMGYSLNDWSVRVILHRIWGEREHRLNDYESWTVQPAPQELERKFWKKWDVEVVPIGLADYINGLSEQLQNFASSRSRR